jgi:hypothetical protein
MVLKSIDKAIMNSKDEINHEHSIRNKKDELRLEVTHEYFIYMQTTQSRGEFETSK